MNQDIADDLPSPECIPRSVRDDRLLTQMVAPRRPPREIPRVPPTILLVPNRAWRRVCQAQVAHIPSGYTYLAQFMGHDIGNSVPLDSVPYVLRGDNRPSTVTDGVLPPRRYNLIDNPLTLETIYGTGPTLAAHLYDPSTMLFRLSPRAHQARLFYEALPAGSPVNPAPIRALQDERNRDTLMLHELAVAWMQFHNRCARRLQADGKPPFRAYAEARAHVVRVWHGILRDDLLPRFVHPVIAGIAEADLSPSWQLDETTLLVGLFRAFHAMPLAAYRFSGSGPHNLDRLLKSGYLPSAAENDWKVGWDQFLGAAPGGPLTGISLSVAREMRMPTSSIAALDFASVVNASPLRLGNEAVVNMVTSLPGDWPQKLTSDQLVQDFTSKFPQAPKHPGAEALTFGPLYQVLMLEAQCHGHQGGFGPLGSALFRSSTLRLIERVMLGFDSTTSDTLENPKTMLELINLVRRTEE